MLTEYLECVPGEKKAIVSEVLVNQNVHRQLQDTLDTRLATIRKRLEDSRADLAQNIDTLVEDSVDTREGIDVASKIRLYYRPSHPLESRDWVCLLSELAAGSQLRK